MRLFLTFCFIFVSSVANADKIPYNPRITMNVGDTVTLKGVRTQCDGKRAPRFFLIAGKFPKVDIGKFKNGGVGTVMSNSCGKEVPARAVLFVATKKGKASFTLYKDKFSITVK